MKTFSIRPIGPLRRYVDRIWGWESVGNELVDLPTLLPGTGAEVFFHYRTPFRRQVEDRCEDLGAAHLICVRRRPMRLAAARDVGFVAVRIRAGFVHRPTNLPGSDLVDQTPSVDALWGKAGAHLKRQVCAAPRRADIVRLLSRFLMERLEIGRSDPLVECAVEALYHECTRISVDRLASDLGIARRQLERRFKALTAQTPVEVRQLSRLQKVIRTLMLDPTASVLDVALGFGYYDQSHFVHSFKRLGLGPPQRHISWARSRTHFYNTPWGVSEHSAETFPD